MSVATTYEHISLTDTGVPYIKGSTVKVVELVIENMAYGWSPEEIHFQHPHLSLGQIHSAFAYYWDHRAELDRDIKERSEHVERVQSGLEANQIRDKLKAKGLL